MISYRTEELFIGSKADSNEVKQLLNHYKVNEYTGKSVKVDDVKYFRMFISTVKAEEPVLIIVYFKSKYFYWNFKYFMDKKFKN